MGPWWAEEIIDLCGMGVRKWPQTSQEENKLEGNILFTIRGWPKLFGKFVQNSEKIVSMSLCTFPFIPIKVVRLQPKWKLNMPKNTQFSK